MRRWECRYETFNPVHYPNHLVTKAKKEHVTLPRDQPTWCPLVHKFDPNIHFAVAHWQLRVFFGRIPVHYKHGAHVIFFAPAGAVKLCVRPSLSLDSSCTTHSTRWSAHIWPIFLECSIQVDPTTEEVVQALLYATVDM